MELEFNDLTFNDDSFELQQRELLSQRKVVLNSQISDNAIEDVCMWIIMWNQEDKDLPKNKRKKIVLFVNTDGGDCLTGGMILSAIKHSITPVVTVGLGKCNSMGSYILAAGHERYCFPSTILLYHDGQTGYVSSGNKGKDVQRFFDRLNDIQTKFMVENTKLTEEFIEENKDRELYLFADEIKAYGVVDKIIGVDCSIDAIL